MSAPKTPNKPSSLAVGDPVTLPEGQKGVLRYVGKVQGKPGEYAGVELGDEWESYGRHSGTFNGVSYFSTDRPNTGVFITYSKLIGSTTQASVRPSLPTSARRQSLLAAGGASIPGLSTGPASAAGTTTHTAQPTVASSGGGGGGLAGSPFRTSRPLAQKPLGAPALSAPRGSLTTPRRSTRPSAVARAQFSPTADTPSRRPRTSGLHRPLLEEPGLNGVNGTNGGGGGGASEAAAAELAALSKELRETRAQMADKDAQLKQQSELLKDLEQSLEEFQELAKTRQDESDGGDKANLVAALEEKDRKMTAMRAEFEQKRQEFRTIIGSLESEVKETSDVYESELRSLKASMGQADDFKSEMAEMERMISELEIGLKNSQMSEQNAVAQLGKLADIENKLLDREQELQDTKSSLEYYKGLVKDMDSRPDQSGSGTDNDALVAQLNAELDQERQNRIQSQREVESLESMLESKVFREQELEKQVEELLQKQVDDLKITSPSASSAADDTPQTPPQLSEPATTTTPAAARVTPSVSKPVTPAVAPAKVDPAAGREQWCGLCEREGHDALECPYEDEF